jgi:CRP/FNR family cyclic AMP-dependent transcriptional regulator
MIAELEQIQLFKDISGEALKEINAFCTRLELEDGDAFISENDLHSRDLFLLCSGRVEVITSSTGITSSESIISEQDKELFGEISWISGNKRTATVRCIGEVVAIRINGSQFMAYLESHPETGFIVMRAIVSLVADSLSSTNQLLKQILWNTAL